MKNHNFNLKALALILALTISGQSYAHKYSDNVDGKKVVKININAPLVKFITNTMDINSEDLEHFKQHLQEANLVLITNNIMDLEFILTESEIANSLLLIEYDNEDCSIKYCMSDGYCLYTEATPVIEDWMTDEDYLNTEVTPVIEDWMTDEDYLNTEVTPVIEDWMMNQLNI